MSENERIRFSLNLRKPEHAKAWEQLQQYSGKQRSEFIINCIVAAADEDHLAKVMGRVLDEKLGNIQLQQPLQPPPAPPQQAFEAEIPVALLDFGDQF